MARTAVPRAENIRTSIPPRTPDSTPAAQQRVEAPVPRASMAPSRRAVPMAGLLALCSSLALLSCLSSGVDAFASVEEVPGTVQVEGSATPILRAYGRDWEVHHSEQHGRVYFVETESKRSIWTDPRDEVLTEEDKALLHEDELAAYEAAQASKSASVSTVQVLKAGTSVLTIVVVAVVPMVLFAAGIIARIWYLQKYHPGLLFPTKERKKRFRNNSKFKPQKARGKMSQDGKGGRSANS